MAVFFCRFTGLLAHRLYGTEPVFAKTAGGSGDEACLPARIPSALQCSRRLSGCVPETPSPASGAHSAASAWASCRWHPGSAAGMFAGSCQPAAPARQPCAVNLPWRQMTEERMAHWPAGTLFVVYCAGPHCNGADRAALQLARLGRPVKIMIGGITGWEDEQFEFAAQHFPVAS